MKYPNFPLYVQDFLVGTLEFTAEEIGGYIRLLCHQWDKGSIPDDDKKLLHLSGVKSKALPAIKAKFKKGNDGLLRNERLEKERTKLDAFREKQKDNGSRGGRPRKNTEQEPESKPNETQNKGLGFSGFENQEPKKSLSLSQSLSLSEEEKREKETPTPVADFQGLPVIIERPESAPSLEQVEECFFRLGTSKMEAKSFFDYYEGLNWKKGISTIVNWQSFANRWVAGEKKQGTNAKSTYTPTDRDSWH